MSEIHDGDVCFIPLTESHFLKYNYPWKLAGEITGHYVKGYFLPRKKGASTFIVRCSDFDLLEFCVNMKWINEFGRFKEKTDAMNVLTAEDIDSFYDGNVPAPSRVLDSNESTKKASKLSVKSTRKHRTVNSSISDIYSVVPIKCKKLERTFRRNLSKLI